MWFPGVLPPCTTAVLFGLAGWGSGLRSVRNSEIDRVHDDDDELWLLYLDLGFKAFFLFVSGRYGMCHGPMVSYLGCFNVPKYVTYV
ncbi:hypothetical protein DM02DRAFT_612285, partial [Periconia macrospinosa]